MRIAILSDVHGDRLALDAAPEDVGGHGFVGAPAHAVAERSKDGGSVALRGVACYRDAMSRLAAKNGRPERARPLASGFVR